MDTFTIGDQPVGPGEPTFIIAEAGSNHDGDLETAKELIDVAVDAGADAVKFQTFRAEDIYVEDSGEIEYLNDDRSIYEIVKSIEMPYEWIPELHDYCDERDIYFLSTPCDEQSAEELAEYVPVWKIASLTSSHHPFVRYLAQTEKPIIMSTGAHELDEIRENVDVLHEAGAEAVSILQCVAAYPTPLEDANVDVVNTLADEFGVITGYSDHTLGPVTAPAAAVAAGADIIEKHFTLDKTMEGPDHEFALEPDGLAEMVTAVRNTEAALGTGEKTVLDVESEIHTKARRGVHAVNDISAGEEFTTENLKILRPGEQESGLHPKHYDKLLGETAGRDIQKSAGIQWDDVDGHGS